MHLSGMAKMAWRNLWRNRRRTLITCSAIAFGTMLAVLFTGLGDANWSAIIDLAARLGGGHITLQHPEFLDKPASSRTIQSDDEWIARASAQEHVVRAAPRIVGQVMLATARDSFGAAYIAYDPGREDSRTLSMLEAVKQGRAFSRADENGILLGSVLAQNLGTRIGSKVVYTLTDKKGDIVSGMAKVTGIIRTGSPGVDLGLCLLPIDVTRRVLGYQKDESTQVAVFLDDHRHSQDVAERLVPDGAGPVVALAWNQSNPDLAAFISMKQSGTLFFELLVMLLACAGIFTTLFVSVMERRREFGILMAIGFRPMRLFLSVVLESALLALVGLVSSAILTVGPYCYLNVVGVDLSFMVGDGSMEVAGVAMSPIMFVDIFWEHALVIVLAVLLATLLSGLYPAWRASRIVPVESVKLV